MKSKIKITNFKINEQCEYRFIYRVLGDREGFFSTGVCEYAEQWMCTFNALKSMNSST